MAKKSYIQPGDAGFSTQLLTFKSAIGGYSVVLGVTLAQQTEQAADADYFEYVVTSADVMQKAATQWSNWKAIMRDGGVPPVSGAPVAAALPAAVPPVAPGIESRFRALVRQIKAHSGYNAGIGAALGIEGEESTGPDLDTITPDLSAKIVGGQVVIGWGWQGYGSQLDMIEIQVDRGAGFSLLTFDTTPGYTDSTPHPASPAKWTYKAIYRKGDAPVGQWTAPVTLTVGG